MQSTTDYTNLPHIVLVLTVVADMDHTTVSMRHHQQTRYFTCNSHKLHSSPLDPKH